MSGPFRVAVVGLGYFSQFHLKAWQSRPDTDLVALCDRDSDRVHSQARGLGVPGYDSLAQLLTHNAVDILDIVAPPAAHAALLSQCLGKTPVIVCQKPFCTSLEEAEQMTQAAEKAGTRLIIHENFRFQPWYREVKDLLSDPSVGTVYQARFALRPGDGRGPSAYLDRQPAFQTMPRLLVHETGVHFLDLFRWLFGPIDAVYADLRRLNPAIAGEDAGLVICTHRNGVRSIFDGNRLVDHAADNPRLTMGLFEVEAEGGVVALDGYGGLSLRRFGASTPQPVDISRDVDATSFGGGCTAALIDHVVEATKGERPFENEARDYLDILRLSAMVYRSAKEQRAITWQEGSP